MQMKMLISKEQVEKYHQDLPERICTYLNQRCILDKIINKFKLGWNSNAITIPIYNRKDEYVFFKYRIDPEKETKDSLRYWYDEGASAELYGWENITHPKPFLIICEGELDRLVLESKEIPAVTSTGGVNTFKPEWIEAIKDIPELYICYDSDKPGMDNAQKLARDLPQAKIVILPQMPDDKKDITDFFMLGNTIKDFLKLLREARTLEEIELDNQIDMLQLSGGYTILHPSQEFIDNRGYFTVPILIPNEKENSPEPFKQVFLVITSDRRRLLLLNKRDFYQRHRLFVPQLPLIKNPDIRWDYKYIKEFTEGYIADPLKTYELIKDIYYKYIELKEVGWYTVLPLWCIGTYFYQIFESYPYLALTGFKNTGKSKLTRLTTYMAFNSMLSVNISEATLFRDTEALRSTIGIDEMENLDDPQKGQTLRSLLNSGYSKGARVPRQEKTSQGRFYTYCYETYSPKIIANIRGLEEVLASRAITITMLKAKTNKGMINVTGDSEDWDRIRHELYCFALCHFSSIENIYLNDLSVKIANNRYNDLWSPLLSISKFIFKDSQEFNKLKDFAIEIISCDEGESLDDWSKALLLALRDLVVEDGWYANKEIRYKMSKYLEEDEINKISASWIGYRLRRFGLHKKDHKEEGIVYYFKKLDIEDLCTRYL